MGMGMSGAATKETLAQLFLCIVQLPFQVRVLWPNSLSLTVTGCVHMDKWTGGKEHDNWKQRIFEELRKATCSLHRNSSNSINRVNLGCRGQLLCWLSKSSHKPVVFCAILVLPSSEKLVLFIPLLTIVVIGFQKLYIKTEVGAGLALNDVYLILWRLVMWLLL
jgi:hypothetical protein